ncbi:MAG TPA: hypothetical protein VFX97_14190 [Pyrinomonadaceae bacterium]|nr:hypothetical protein [Pyrinomonadaceae bacterium]
MRMKFPHSLCNLLLVMLLPALPAFAQNASVTVGKQVGRIPKVCESVVPASIEGTVDIPALVKEAYCKGAGDMITEYSYVMNSLGRSIDKKGQTKQGSTTYEVFIPTLKSGTRGKGVLVITARDGVPVPAAELEKARTEAGERLEKAEEKSARERQSLPPQTDSSAKGMLPLGMYTYTTNGRSSFFKKGSARLGIHTFLRTCDLTLTRRGQHEGREILVFNFTPRPDAQFKDSEKYIAQLTGEIWIDAHDRIVTRLTGWPSPVASIPGSTNPPPASGERPPAVYVEMQRLPEGIWLPRIIRINGADYQKLFDGIDTESISIFSNYIRFSTEIKDVKVNTPSNP